MSGSRKMPRVPKPTKKKTPSPKRGEYHYQLGRTYHPTFVHRFDTEAKARAAACKVVDSLEGDMKRWNSAGLEALADLRSDIAAVEFGRRREVVCRVIDEYTGLDVYFEFWRQS